jgi:signal recognition particle subunit SRP54
MFNNLTEHLEGVFRKLRGHGKLSEDNIREAMRDIRRALLEADVNFQVVKDFVNSVTERAVGEEVLKSITPGQQIVKVVYDEMAKLLGGAGKPLAFTGSPPHKWMMVGLQGSGKTTLSAKLALFYRKKGRNPLLVAADVYRPAAIDQLEILGKSIGIPVFAGDRKTPVDICKEALAFGTKEGYDLIIFDTAGRLHVDDEMMDEVARIKAILEPQEIFFTADAMTGQDAVNAASSFHQRLQFTGVALTKLDGDARGGAALSILSVTGKPIRFAGVGEKVDALELFHPERMASRILGMGDVVSLVEKAQENVDEESARALEKKITRAQFTLQDFKDQLVQLKKMGPLESLLKMVPGLGSQMKGLTVDDNALTRVEAIINSMTKKERAKPVIIDGSRRKRIAQGSGTTVNDINRLLKQFSEMQKMMKKMGGMMGKMRGMQSMGSRFGFGH